MKLYVYDHCPYSVRARMAVGLHRLPVEMVYLLNDDEATPISLIGAKQVPILQKDDGSHMGESLDIVHYLQQYAGKAPLNVTIRPEVQAWFDRFGEYGNRLIMPRDVQLNLPEFATQAAIDYFVTKKEANVGKFSDLLAQSDAYIARANQELAQLATLLSPSSHYLNGTDLSLEDIIIFPLLRNLSMVRDVDYPAIVRDYVDFMAQESQINLYFDHAI